MINPRFYTLVAIVLAAAAARLLPHPPNFAPIAAIALFGGVHFTQRGTAFLVPLAAMLLSDLLIGFHDGMPFVYAAFAIIVGMGMWIRPRLSPLSVAGGAVSASVLFFLLTNFGVWLTGGLYPLTGAGLAASYAAAIPFFAHTIAGDLFYTVLLFGGFALAERTFPVLQEAGRTAPSAG